MINRVARTAVLAAGLALMGAGAAHADVTFEDVATGNYGTNSVQSGGFTFNTTYFQTISNATGFGASNETNYLAYLGLGTNTETFSASSGTPFTLSSIDLGGWTSFGPNARDITITGTQVGGNLVSFTANVLPSGFTTFDLRTFNFTNLQSVTLGSSGDGYYVAVDNIIATPVPEPETLAMLLAGTALLVGAVRRQRSPGDIRISSVRSTASRSRFCIA